LDVGGVGVGGRDIHKNHKRKIPFEEIPTPVTQFLENC
jgi:hypothetical protein